MLTWMSLVENGFALSLLLGGGAASLALIFTILHFIPDDEGMVGGPTQAGRKP